MDEQKRYIVWWSHEGRWADDIFNGRAPAEKFAEAKAEALPGVTIRLFEEVARVTAEVKPRATWRGVPNPEPAKQEARKVAERSPGDDVAAPGWCADRCQRALYMAGKPYPQPCPTCGFGKCTGPKDVREWSPCE